MGTASTKKPFVKTRKIHEFEKWAIRGTYETKKNSEGVVCMITYRNGSTIQLLTYNSKIDVFESWTGDVWIPDEPPPHDIFEATARGLHVNRGKIFLFMTPLKEPWILNELIEPEHERFDVVVMDGLTFLDNEADIRDLISDILKDDGFIVTGKQIGRAHV